MKLCPACNTEKETSEFWRDSARADGFQRACKVCLRIRQSSYVKANRPKINARTRKWARKKGWATQRREWRKMSDFKLRASLNRFFDVVTPEMIVAYRRRLLVARSRRALLALAWSQTSGSKNRLTASSAV